jgi:hypothetical protein
MLARLSQAAKKEPNFQSFIVEWISNFTPGEFNFLTELLINTRASEKILHWTFMGKLTDLTRVKEWHISRCISMLCRRLLTASVV